MKDFETDPLVAEMEALPEYRGWQFKCEHPFYYYSHPDNGYRVFCTPDWAGDESLPIEVQGSDGYHYAEHDVRFPLPRDGRTASQIFALVQPTLDRLLDRLLACLVDPPRPREAIEMHVSLTSDEVAALQKAHEYMMYAHGWGPRATAMAAISKVISAALKS